MSHDRGCFRCFEDHPKSNVKCAVYDCPYRNDHMIYLAERNKIIADKVSRNKMTAFSEWYI